MQKKSVYKQSDNPQCAYCSLHYFQTLKNAVNIRESKSKYLVYNYPKQPLNREILNFLHNGQCQSNNTEHVKTAS
jgi:hypothetical protein